MENCGTKFGNFLKSTFGIYPYDNFEDHDAVTTLRSGGDEVNHELEKEIRVIFPNMDQKKNLFASFHLN